MIKPGLSLTTKMIIFTLVLVLFASLAMQFLAFQTATTAIEQTIGETALNIARSVGESIDVEKLTLLQNEQDMDNAYYQELRERLNSLRTAIGLKYLYTMRQNQHGDYIYVVDGAPADDDEASLLGEVEEEVTDQMLRCFSGQEGYELNSSDLWGDLISAYVPLKNKNQETIAILGADFDANHVMRHLSATRSKMLYSAGIIALAGIILGILFALLIVSSLRQLQAKVELARQGDLRVKVNNNSRDEIGKLSRAFAAMIESTATIIYNIRANTKSVADYIQLLHGKTTGQARTAAMETAAAKADTSSIEDVSRSMREVFKQIQMITSNIKTMEASSHQSMTDAQEAMQILANSVRQINLVNDTVDNTAETIRNLAEKVTEIRAFSDRVSTLAKQTNLLSMNAAVEASRAAAHGKGFAVVAGEIKILAEQSSEASKQIDELIAAVWEEMNHSSHAVETGVLQARSGVTAISQVESILSKLYHSNREVDNSVKIVSQAIVAIQKDSSYVLESTLELRKNLNNVIVMMKNLEETVNSFIIEK